VKPSPGAVNRFQIAQSRKTKPPSQPNAAQVELLRKSPELAGQFDAKFGQGAAKKFLEPHGDVDILNYGPDGSVETLYTDGWAEVRHPDGSISGYQADEGAKQ